MNLYSRSAKACSAELDGTACLFDPSTAEYLNLNSSGSATWNAISVPKTIEDIISELLDQFEVESDQCMKETVNFLEEAENKGLIKEINR
jgi:hypothetical protein